MNRNADIEAIDQDGYAIVPHVLTPELIRSVLSDLENAIAHEAVSQRAGKAFGIRNLLNVIPAAAALARSERLRLLVEPILGRNARIVRGVFFDKNRTANWKVAWHQDLTIAVGRRVETEGYSSWSTKAGITHVQPPVSVLEKMLAVRVHLDDTDVSNGALHVIPGSHKHGRLTARDIQSWKEHHQVIACPVATGGAMLMKPLLLHASSMASNPEHRRVLHFEYSSSDLHGELAWYDA